MPRQANRRHSAYFWLMFWLWSIAVLGLALWAIGILKGAPPQFVLPGRMI